jgi:hypothetical protein
VRGDKPMPTELKVLRMTAKKADKLIRKITPTRGPLIDPPNWLTDDQKAEWGYAIKNAPRDVLKKIDKACWPASSSRRTRIGARAWA